MMNRRRAVMMASDPSDRWPSSFQPVEWIGMDGSQHINTDYNWSKGARIVIKAYSTNSTQDSYLFINPSWIAPYIALNWYKASKVIYHYNNARTSINTTLSVNTWYTFDCSNVLKKDGTTLTTKTAVDFSTSTAYLRLFGNSSTTGFKGRVSEVKCYDADGNLTFDGRPCYRLRDNEIGLFDVVGNKFYTNNGTGTFTKGGDVSA